MNILGLSAYSEDSAATLLCDGQVVAAAAEERFTSVKHDGAFPKRSIRFCLRTGGIEPPELDYVVFYEKPLRRFERVLATQLGHFPRSGRTFARSLFTWLGERLWTKNHIASEVGVPPGKVVFAAHHESLAASAFLPSPFDEAAVLVLGGEGEWACTSLGHGSAGRVEPLAEIRFPHSLGLFSAAMTQFLGFVPFAEEHKLFQLAALGEPRFQGELEKLLRVGADGGYELDLEPFRFAFDTERTFEPALEERLGPARVPGETLRASGDDTRDADLAASFQVVFEDALLALARQLHERVPTTNLCLSGAAAHNPRANARLLAEGPFDNLFVQPGAGGAAGALGAALHLHCAVLGKERAYVQDHAFLGEDAVAEHTEEPENGEVATDEASWAKALAEHVAAGRLVGLVRGRAEWGTRSLGHRTLLADPRSDESRERINRGVKHREDFRPFAPAVTAERADELFELPPGAASPARFKLISAAARNGAREQLPAAFHRDGTATVQVVHQDATPHLHALLEAFEAVTGYPVLLTAALNLRGDPIVRGAEQALNVFERTELDVLAIEDRIYTRS
jgi:carbamoyltransferase